MGNGACPAVDTSLGWLVEAGEDRSGSSPGPALHTPLESLSASARLGRIRGETEAEDKFSPSVGVMKLRLWIIERSKPAHGRAQSEMHSACAILSPSH